MPLTGNLSEKAGSGGSGLLYFVLLHFMDADIILCNISFMTDLIGNKKYTGKAVLCVVRNKWAS